LRNQPKRDIRSKKYGVAGFNGINK